MVGVKGGEAGRDMPQAGAVQQTEMWGLRDHASLVAPEMDSA